MRFTLRHTAVVTTIVLTLLILAATSLFGAEPSLTATQSTFEPYVQLNPSVIGTGGTVTVFGSGFCPDPACSPVTVRVNDRVVASQVQVDATGQFQTAFVVTEIPGVYEVVASQTLADGSVIQDNPGLQVRQGGNIPRLTPTAVPSHFIYLPLLTKNAEPGPGGPLPGPGEPHPIEASRKATVLAVTEFAPNIKWGGRAVAVDVHPSSPAIAIAAAESGGLFRTTNGGVDWSHIDTLPPFRMSDVKYSPRNASIVIATAFSDSRVPNQGGIWRSVDGGLTWARPATADPPTTGGCSAYASAYGIAFAPDVDTVYVGTDCGLAISANAGASWTHRVPNPASPGITSVVAQAGGIVDICSGVGHERSTNSGGAFGGVTAGSPGCVTVHGLAPSPVASTVLYATGYVAPPTGCGRASAPFEGIVGTGGVVTWTQIKPATCVGGGRNPWIETHVSRDGDPTHVDVYFGSGLATFRQTCTGAGPGTRCRTTDPDWTSISVDHADQNGLAFNSSGNCALYIVSDGGIHTTTSATATCGDSWTMTGASGHGFNALQLYEVAGQVHTAAPIHTDLYIGTQDNEIWASGDGGLTWPANVCCEGFFFEVAHSSPTDAGQTMTGVVCAGCSNFRSAPNFSGFGAWNEPPVPSVTPPVMTPTATPAAPITGNPFIIENNVFIEFGQPNPPASQLYLTTNAGSMWSVVAGAVISRTLQGRPLVSGPAANPTVYQAIRQPGNRVNLIKLTGVRSGPVAIAGVNGSGGHRLINIGNYCMGQGTFVCPFVYGVDPNNPLHLIAADVQDNQMKVTTDGGITWRVDSELTSLVTGGGQFLFKQCNPRCGGWLDQTQAHVIQWDPTNGNRIFVGTEAVGILYSANGGENWAKIPGSEKVVTATAFFVDEREQVVYVSTYGRGLWKLPLPAAPTIQVFKNLRPSLTPPRPGDLLTFDIIVRNVGPLAITQLPLDDFFDPTVLQFVSASTPPNAALPGRLEWDSLTSDTNGFGTSLASGASFTVTTTFRVLACPSAVSTLNKVEVSDAQDASGAELPRISRTTAADIVCASATLTKTRVGPQRVAQDELVYFEVTIHNTGNIPITTLPLVDTFDPNALTFVGSVPSPNLATPLGTLTWNNLGPLAPGASVIVRQTFRATGCPPGQTTTNTVRITGAVATGPSGPISLGPLVASASVDIACPSLRVDKALLAPVSGVALRGDMALFRVTITNQGNKKIRFLPLEDLFDPDHLAFVSASKTPTAIGAGHVQWSDLTASGPGGFGMELEPGSSFTLVITFVAIGCPDDQETTNKAKVSGAIDEENNPTPTAEDTATVKIACPSVAVSKVVANLPPCGYYGVGDPIQFTITITNTGNTTLVTVPLVDTYDPTYLSFSAATPTPNLTTLAGTLTWTDLTGPAPNGFGVDLAPGATFTVSVTFTALASTSGLPGGVTVDRAQVQGAVDEYGFAAPTASASASVKILDADLYIEKTQVTQYPLVEVRDGVANTLGMSPYDTILSNQVVMAGEVITYNIKYGNRGPDEAAFVRIIDTIPPGTIYLGHNLAPCLDRDIRMACFVGRVAPGEKREFQVWVRVPRVSEAVIPPGTVLVNTVTIASGFTETGPACGTPDGMTANNTARYHTTILADYGDAPAAAVGTDLPGYGGQVTGAFSGNYGHEWLGRAVSGERSASDGLDIDAETNLAPFNTDHHDDGVFFRNPFALSLPTSQRFYIPGERAVTARVTVSVADASSGRYNVTPDKRLYIYAWADSNKNGVFGDAGDQIMFEWNGAPGTVGSDGSVWPSDQPFHVMDLRIRVPGETGWMMVRVRLSYGVPPTPGGAMDYGEIEDYLIGVFPGTAPVPIPGPSQPRPAAP